MFRSSFFAVLFGIGFASFSGMAQEVCIQSFHGQQRTLHLKEVSNFYNAFYREPPYFYDANEEAWDRYIHSYIDVSESVVCVAMQDEVIIGIVIGTPLVNATQKYKAAFIDRPDDLQSLFYLGELAVKAEYKHLGVDKLLYEEFERQVAKKQQYSGICVWQLESEENKSSDLFWRDMGFACSDIRFEELWKDTYGTQKVAHPMVCWKKLL